MNKQQREGRLEYYSAHLFSLQFDEPAIPMLNFSFHMLGSTHNAMMYLSMFPPKKKMIWSSLQHWLASKTIKNSTLCKQLIGSTAGIEHKIANDLLP